MRRPERKTPNYAAQPAAQALAERIETYWRVAGHPAVRVWLSQYNERGDRVAWAVRSNLVDGLPP